MNKVFRVIWSEAQGAWVAVSETTKSHSKRSRKSALALALTAGSLMTISGAAVATGTFVSAGDASIAITSSKCNLNTAADGKNSVSIGCGAGAGAAGEFTGSKADSDTSIGYQAGIGVKGKENTAIGSNAGENVTGNDNTAFGVSAGKLVTGSKNVSLGFNSGFQLNGDGNISAGDASGGSIHGDNNVMLGTAAKVKGSAANNRISDTVLIGTRASASSSDNVAIGKDTQATHANSVALGHASVTSEAKAITEGSIVDSAGTTHTYSGFDGVGSQANGAVSVGALGAERQIVNVAAGAITSSSTDAVNGSQLYGVAKGLNDQVNDLGSSVAGSLGGGSKYEGGKVTADLTVGGNSYTNVQDALNNISTAGGWTLGSKDANDAAQDLAVDAGGKVNLNAGKNMQVISKQDASGEITTTFATTPNVTHESVTTGDTVMNDNGVTIKDGPSMTKAGISAGNLIISNVKAGIADTDGVNVSQLGNVAAVIGGVTVDANGKYTGPTFNVNKTENTTIAGAIAELDKGWTLSDGNAGTTQVQAGDTAVIKAGDNMDVTIDATGEMIVKTKDIVKFTDATVSNNLTVKGVTKLGDNFAVNNDNSVNYTGPITKGDHITNKTYVDSGRTVVTGGTNVAGIVAATDATTGQTSYTVNADGASVSTAADSGLTITGAKDDTTNITDYTVGLSDKTKTSLGNADSALQTVVTQVDGTDVKTLTKGNNNANFVSGKNIQLSDDGKGGIQVATEEDVVFENTTINNDLTVGGVTKLGDKFVVNTDNSVEYSGPITKGDHITNKTYVDGQVGDLANTPLTFAGDSGTNVERKLGETVGLKGGAVDEAALTDGNIGVVANGTDTLEIKLNKDIDLGNDGSLSIGDTFIDGDSVATKNLTVNIDNGKSFTVNKDGAYYSGPITDGDHITNKTYVDKISAASKTEIAAGSNVANVAVSTGADGQAIYTVNADGASVSGGSDAVKVVAGTKDPATNITDYAVDLSDKTKTSLKDADSALQTVVTQVDGVDVKSLTKDDNKANFVSGTNIKLSDDGKGGIQVATEDEVTFTQVTTGDSVLNKDGLQVGADVFVTNQGLQAGNTFITNNGLTFNNSTVAVTAAGINAGGQKITNVAAGTESTDGVNFGQLESVKNTAEQGWNVSVNGGTAEQVKPGATVDFEAGNNIQISQNGTEIKIETTPDVKHNKVTTGQSSLDNDGLKVGADVAVTDTGLKAGGTSVTDAGLTFDGSSVAVNKGGINAGGNKITNVAAGTELTDGVNFGQLKDVENKVNQGWNLVSDGKTSNVGAGGKVSIEGGANIKVAHDGAGNLTIATTPDVKHNSVTTGDTVMNDNGVTIKGGPSITKNGVDAGDKKITSVAKGEISETSTDAINGSQLNETNNRVTKNEGDIKNIQNGKDGMFQVSQDYNAPAPEPTGKKSAAGGAGAVASGDNSTAIGNDAKATASNSTALGNSALASANNSVALGQGSVADRANSVSVGTVGGERQITNVAAGVAPTDAVNVSQLDALGSKVNQYFNAANKRIDKVDNNARAGIAAAMAAGTLPQSTLPGKSMVTVGASTYRGESALAIGVSRLSDNARTVIKANASADSRGNAGAAVGAGWHW